MVLVGSLDNPNIEVIAINDVASMDIMVHLFKYDSIHGTLDEQILISDNGFVVGNNNIKFFNEKDPTNLPWKELDIDIVIEATGRLEMPFVIACAKASLLDLVPILIDLIIEKYLINYTNCLFIFSIVT